MRFRLEIEHAPGHHTGAAITTPTKPLKHGISWKRPKFGEKDEVLVLVDIPLDEYACHAFAGMQVSLNYTALEAVESFIEAAFLAGIEYAKKNEVK